MADVKPTVYVETTIPSYLTAWPSKHPLIASYQQMTKDWWQNAMNRYDLFASQTVIDEVSQGDPSAAGIRLASLQNVTVLPTDPQVLVLAARYIEVLQLPPKALNDAVHLGYAVVFEMDYLATWNMRHLANSLTMRRITEYNVSEALHIPLLVTPEYLLQLTEGDKA